jgi:hypothetical protein
MLRQGAIQLIVLDTMVSERYDTEGVGNGEPFWDDAMSQHRTSIGHSTISQGRHDE